MDYFENREDKLRPLGEFAFNLLRRCFDCEFSIVTSILVTEEVEYNGHTKNLLKLNKKLNQAHKLIKISIAREDRTKAHKLKKKYNISFNDSLHAVLAAKANVDFLVTRNIKDFYQFQDIVDITLPEQI